MQRTLAMLAAVLASTLISACASRDLSPWDDDKNYYNASTGPVNHTSQYLYGYSVNGAFGPNVSAYGWDIAGTCCVRLPRVYRPGLVVDIKYDLTIDDDSKHNWKTKKAVSVEPYDKPGSLYVHFFPNDEIRVVVTKWDPNGEGHPIPLPVNPNRKNRSQRK